MVGINTFILTNPAAAKALASRFRATWSDRVTSRSVKDGHVHRGQIGIVAQTITPAIAKGLGLAQDWGVIAADVDPDGPADKAGLKPGDIIDSLGGREMDDARQLETLLYQQPLSAVVDLR